MKVTKRLGRIARQLFGLCIQANGMDEKRVRQVAAALTASRRRGAFGVLVGFQRLVRLHRDRHAALVESAVPLPDDLRQDLSSRLDRVYGGRLATDFRENAALIGGVRIQVGSDVYDTSIRATLAALEARL